MEKSLGRSMPCVARHLIKSPNLRVSQNLNTQLRDFSGVLGSRPKYPHTVYPHINMSVEGSLPRTAAWGADVRSSELPRTERRTEKARANRFRFGNGSVGLLHSVQPQFHNSINQKGSHTMSNELQTIPISSLSNTRCLPVR